jgi:hypothetical protein
MIMLHVLQTTGWFEVVPRYCESALAAQGWAEPAIAGANLAFLLTAVLCARDLRLLPFGRVTAALWLLLAETVLIGTSSLLFHVFQTRWSRALDLFAIALFMLTFAAVALRGLVGFSVRATATAMSLFIAACIGAVMVRCGTERCLSGTLSYVPALVAMTAIGCKLGQRSKPAGSGVLTAAGLLFGALLLRGGSFPLCREPGLTNVAVGSLLAWLLLLALMLWFLLHASIAVVANENTLPRIRR